MKPNKLTPGYIPIGDSILFFVVSPVTEKEKKCLKLLSLIEKRK